MSFVNPTYLWAFLGLLVPIAIHFWSNKEGKVIKIGSVKFLENSESSQSKSIKLNEYLLLFLRLLLISLIVFILAEPQLNTKSKNSSLTYIVEASLLKNKTIQSLIKTLKQNQEIRVLAEGLPFIDDYKKDTMPYKIVNYWQISEQFNTIKTDSIVVFTKGLLSGIKGKRPTINYPIKWIVLEEQVQQNEEPIIAFKENETIHLISSKSTAKHLYFNTKKISFNAIKSKINQSQDSITINSKTIFLKDKKEKSVFIYFDEKFTDQKYFIETTLKAIEKYTNQSLKIEQKKSVKNLKADSYSLIIWLSREKPPVVKTKIVQFFPDDLALSIINKTAIKNTYHLTEMLSTKTMLNKGFANHLYKLLYNYKLDKNIINKIDKRIVSESELQTKFNSEFSKKNITSNKNIANMFWFPFVLILVLERAISIVKKQ